MKEQLEPVLHVSEPCTLHYCDLSDRARQARQKQMASFEKLSLVKNEERLLKEKEPDYWGEKPSSR